jgi:formylglycine-generating enzyme required for sulfatase activity
MNASDALRCAFRNFDKHQGGHEHGNGFRVARDVIPIRTSTKVSQVGPTAAEPAPPLAGPSPAAPDGQWIDLLGNIDLKRDLVAGSWKQEADGLVVTPGPLTRLMLPVVVEGSYDLEVEFTRHAGTDGTFVYFPIGWQHEYLVLGCSGGKCSTFGMIGCWGAGPENPFAREGMIANDRRHTVKIAVRPLGPRVALEAFLDGQSEPYLQWQGLRGIIGLHASVAIPSLRRPALGANQCAVTFHVCRVRPVQTGAGESGTLRLLRVGEICEEPFVPAGPDGSGVRFHEIGPAGSHLAGFRAFLWPNDCLRAIQPLFRTPTGMIDGLVHGGEWTPDGAPMRLGEPKVLLAKDGYAVGSVALSDLRKARPGAFSGMRVTFMRLKNQKLDPLDSYQGEWIGEGVEKTTVESKGELVIGIHGSWGGGIGALGLLLTRAGAPVNQPGSTPPLAVAPFDEKKAREHQEAWAKYRGVPVEITNSIGMKLVLIPPGEFVMGSPQEFIEEESRRLGAGSHDMLCVPDEAPQHRVRITQPFWLGVTKVTQEEYERVMGNNPSHFCASGGGKAKVEGQDTRRFPVDKAIWADKAEEFCRRLSDLPGEKGARRRYELPTEAQWEYACRAGSTGKYCFGDEEWRLGDYAWYRGNSDQQTHPVAQKRPNAWGLYDVHGNIWEWCRDEYGKDYYGRSPTDDPFNAPKGNFHVIRGGSWSVPAASCRSARRYDHFPLYWGVGLRVSLIAEAQEVPGAVEPAVPAASATTPESE